MTLDEAIAHTKEVAERLEDDYRLCPLPNDLQDCDPYKDCRILANGKDKGCLKCANEHRQLESWLKELQQRRAMMESLKEQILTFKAPMKEKLYNQNGNSDYLTGYVCALSVVEGMIAEVESENNGSNTQSSTDNVGSCKNSG